MGPAFHAAGYQVHYHDVGIDDWAVLDPLEPDILVVLGGPIGVYQDDIYPFLKDVFLQQRLAAGKPVMGVCLGAQLIARALGAKVYPSGHVEIGFAPVTLSDAGMASCLAPFAERPITLHWHGDTFDLPEGAALLASTPKCRHQAFSIGRNVIAFQFHPEADPRRIEQWLFGHTSDLHQHDVDIPALRREAGVYANECRQKAAAVLNAWLEQLI